MQQVNELELVRRQMPDVPLMFGVIAQDYTNPRKSVDSSHHMVGVLSHIYQQLGGIGYLNDFSSTTPIPLPPGKGSLSILLLELAVESIDAGIVVG